MSRAAWDAALYDGKHAFVYSYSKDVIGLLDPKPGERILDLGAGTGHLTAAIAKAGSTVLGLDSSAEMVSAARRNYPRIEFVVGDAASFSLPGTFDAIFSNATLHWVPDAEAVARRIAGHLRAGGRFVAEFGGRGNIARIVAAVQRAAAEVSGVTVRHRWYYPSVGEYAGVLKRCRLEVRFAELFDRPTRLDEGEQGMRNWLAMFGSHLLQLIPEPQRDAVVSRSEELMRPDLFRDGAWHADYRRLRVAAYRPEGSGSAS
jgi:trans-aconitate methyltransferase